MTDLSSPATDITDFNNKATPKIAIIGGGLTGLFTATLLERSFSQRGGRSSSDSKSILSLPEIHIFEKSRSVGRLATRYRTDNKTNRNWQWAFGAQFFTAKSTPFSQFIKPWLETGLLQPWWAKVVDLTPIDELNEDSNQTPVIDYKEQWDAIHARYISTPKMTSWGRELAGHLQHTIINYKTRVAPLSQHSFIESSAKKTELFDEKGASLGQFDWVICTAPNIQAMELMVDSGFNEQAKITQPKMLACYTLMLGWEDLQTLPNTLQSTSQQLWDVAYVQDSILGRVFVEHQKPAHDNLLPSVTIHARNDWSEQHVDEDIESIQAQLLAAAKQALNWNDNTAPSQVDCHRWRYAATAADAKNDALGILVDNEHQWIVSGDWCGQGNIESCYQMAEETVQTMTATINYMATNHQDI